MDSDNSEVQFHADTNVTFPISRTEATSPRATPQPPYLLTMTVIPHGETLKELPFNQNVLPENMMFPYTFPSMTLPSTSTAQAQLLGLIQQRVAEATERVATSSQIERQRKQKKVANSCLWCNSFWSFGSGQMAGT